MKRFLVIALVSTLAAALSAPATAQEPEEAPVTPIPEVVNIEDPAGDANYLNGQGFSDDGDNSTPADIGSISDILKVWFTHDADVIRAHVLTEAPPSTAGSSAYFFRVMVDAEGDTNCLWFQIGTPGATDPNATEPSGSLRTLCNGADETFSDGVTATIEETADGQGISTVTIPRSLHAALSDDAILGAPTAHARNNLFGLVTAPQIDDTKPGTDYTITPAEKPVKKGCTKGSAKAKKKGCKKKS